MSGLTEAFEDLGAMGKKGRETGARRRELQNIIAGISGGSLKYGFWSRILTAEICSGKPQDQIVKIAGIIGYSDLTSNQLKSQG